MALCGQMEKELVGERKWLTREETLAREPTLSGDGLVAAAVYADAVTSDARLVIALVRKAAEAGALAKRPGATAIAWSVSEVEILIGPLYTVELLVGVLPLMV